MREAAMNERTTEARLDRGHPKALASKRDRRLFGAFLVGAALSGSLALSALHVTGGLHEDAVRGALKLTGRVAGVLFISLFAIGPLSRTRGPTAAALLQVRPLLGLALAGGQVAHAALIVTLFSVRPDTHIPLIPLVGGLAGYVVVAAMAITSFSWGIAAVGSRLRSHIHGAGAWYLVLLFGHDFLIKPVLAGTLGAPSYWPFALLLFSVVGLKLWRPRNLANS